MEELQLLMFSGPDYGYWWAGWAAMGLSTSVFTLACWIVSLRRLGSIPVGVGMGILFSSTVWGYPSWIIGFTVGVSLELGMGIICYLKWRNAARASRETPE